MSSFTMEMLDAAIRKVEGLRSDRAFSHIVPSLHMTERYEDWSRVRSRGRGRRRQRMGHRQNVVTRERPRREIIVLNGVGYAHPQVIAALKHRLQGGYADG